MFLGLMMQDNELYVCTAFQVYFYIMVQILLQNLKLKREADLLQCFVLSFLVLA